MRIALISALIVATLAVAVMARQALRLWRGDEAVARTMQAGLAAAPVRPDVRRGIVRGIVPQLLQITFIIVAVLAGRAANAGRHGASAGSHSITPMSALAVCSLVAMLLCFGLQIAVIWLNKPAFLVPPHMRNEPGARAARRAQTQKA